MARDNKTKQDAFLRVLEARTGSLADPTPDYLRHLLQHVEAWAETIRRELDGHR